MAERPPTKEEIADIRSRIAAYTDENGNDIFHLPDYDRLMNQDNYVARFFMHCTDIPGDHLKNTEEMIIRSFKFRKEKNVHAIRGADLDENLKAKGSLFLRNRDLDGKQLLIFEVKKHTKGAANMDDMQNMFLYFLERVDREDEDGMITIVFDCAGCGIKNMDMEFIRYMIDVLKDYYPYNLNYILVLEMPWVLNTAWRMIKLWLPAGAVKKIKFVSKTTVDEYVHPDQKFVAWGGNDSWLYEFVDEVVEKPKLNGYANSSSSISSEEEIQPVEAKTTAAVTVEPEAKVTFSVDKPMQDYEVLPDYELVFLKGPKGLTASVSISNNTQAPMAFKIKTTSPERYRVRPSLGIIAGGTNVKIEIFYQPVSPDSEDFSDVLKDKFLINLLKDSNDATYKNDIREKKPTYQHRLKASVKKSLLKASPERRESTVPTYDKDKDIYLKELKALEHRHQVIEEELKTNLFYTRLTLLLIFLITFMMMVELYLSGVKSQSCDDVQTFHNDDVIKSSLPDEL